MNRAQIIDELINHDIKWSEDKLGYLKNKERLLADLKKRFNKHSDNELLSFYNIFIMKNLDKTLANDIQGKDYTKGKPDFILDRIIDKGHGAAFYVLLIVTCLGFYGLLWAILALPYLIG